MKGNFETDVGYVKRDIKKLEYCLRTLKKLGRINDSYEKVRGNFACAVKKRDFLTAAKWYRLILKTGLKKCRLEVEIVETFYPLLKSKKAIAKQIEWDIKKIREAGYKPLLY
ncbi:MAG: hypothetical protein WCW13_06960 [archaeon]|jgi:hypothetical protein